MRARALGLGLLLVTGCASQRALRTDTSLGRVVVYKSGVAYFERTGVVDGDSLKLAVPANRLDDLLKSLVVVDASTGVPAPIAYPRATDSGPFVLDVKLDGARPHRVKISYVTEAPAWKPTYRVTLGTSSKVALQGWAIVDNDSGEDWKDVMLGVGASSALSFRFDLQSTRAVQREELSANDRFAAAPPVGDAPYGEGASKVLGELDDDSVPTTKSIDGGLVKLEATKTLVGRQLDAARLQRDVVKSLCLNDKAAQLALVLSNAREHRTSLERAADPATREREREVLVTLKRRGDELAREAEQCVGEEAATAGETRVTTIVDPALPPDDDDRARAPSPAPRPDDAATPIAPSSPSPASRPAPVVARDVAALVAELRAHPDRVVVEGYATADDADAHAASLDRATHVRDKLVAAGVAEDRITVVALGRVEGKSGVRVTRAPAAAIDGARRARELAALPIGAAHFDAPKPLSIKYGASAMVSIVDAQTDGEVIYLYDRETARGNAMFPFRAVRLVNPSDSTLESGPIEVFGDGRFVGEGLAEPIPAKSVGFVPFALDRQVVADARVTDEAGVPRVVAIDRTTLEAVALRTKRVAITLTNRLREAVTVYVRHTPAPGSTITRAPAERERAGAAYLFRVKVPAEGTTELVIEESSESPRPIDVRTAEGLELVRALVATEPPGASRDKLASIVKLADEAVQLEAKIAASRARLAADRRRSDGLRAELATLREAKVARALLAPLDAKLGDIDRRVSRATLEIVEADERLAAQRSLVDDASRALHVRPSSPARAAGAAP